MKRLLAALVLLSLGAGVSLGGDCLRSRAVYTTYVAPVTPVATYAYTPFYAATVYVPKVLEVEVQRDHYYSIDTYYQQSLLADAIVGRLMQQQGFSRDRGVEQQQQQQQSSPSYPQPMPQRPQSQQSARMPSAGTQVDRGRPSAYQDANLIAMIRETCVKCHEAEHRMPLLTQDGKALLDLPRANALDVYFRVNTGAMPKTAPPVDDKFMPLLAKWIDASK